MLEAYFVIQEILSKLDHLRIKAMDKGTPVNGILDSIHAVNMTECGVAEIIDDDAELQAEYEKVTGSVWE